MSQRKRAKRGEHVSILAAWMEFYIEGETV